MRLWNNDFAEAKIEHKPNQICWIFFLGVSCFCQYRKSITVFPATVRLNQTRVIQLRNHTGGQELVKMERSRLREMED